ncbi:MAG: YaaR family protein [Solirubrobacterales bacterium]
MVRINRDGKPASEFRRAERGDVRSIAAGSKSEFNRELTDRDEHQSRMRMAELIGEIEKLTERLGKSFDINDLMKYKRLVQGFLKEATSLAFSLQKDSSFHRRGRAIMLSVRTVNQDVEALISDFTNKKREPTEILESMDKIRGMLLDMLV